MVLWYRSLALSSMAQTQLSRKKEAKNYGSAIAIANLIEAGICTRVQIARQENCLERDRNAGRGSGRRGAAFKTTTEAKA